MIIRLALGTSTPTSITVVATNNWMSPFLKSIITLFFSSLLIRPWIRPTRVLGSKLARFSEITSAASHSNASDSSINVQTQYTCLPLIHASLTLLIMSARFSFDITAVLTRSLPGGKSFITVESKSAYTLIANVLGIGVAVMTNW